MNVTIVEIRCRLFVDHLRRFILPFASRVLYLTGRLLVPLSRVLGVRAILAAGRASFCAGTIRFINRNPEIVRSAYPELIGDAGTRISASQRSIVLKWPIIDPEAKMVLAKGILVISYTETYAYFYWHVDVEKLAKFFSIVLEPSSANYVDPYILFWRDMIRDTVFVESSELRDRVMLAALSSNLVPLSIGASDWVNPEEFVDRGEERSYDSVYVANTHPVKRVYRYLIAIRRIVESGQMDYSGLLVCAKWGGGESRIERYISDLGIQANCELQFDLDKKSLACKLGRAKTSVLLSFKEGSNRTLFESMFCNTPVIALAENIGVNKSYINEFTGQLVSDQFLEESLIRMRQGWRNYTPRNWAMQNISPSVTTGKLIDVINRTDHTEIKASEVAMKCNNPEVSYVGVNNREFVSLNSRLLSVFDKNAGYDQQETYSLMFTLQEDWLGIFGCDRYILERDALDPASAPSNGT